MSVQLFSVCVIKFIVRFNSGSIRQRAVLHRNTEKSVIRVPSHWGERGREGERKQLLYSLPVFRMGFLRQYDTASTPQWIQVIYVSLSYTLKSMHSLLHSTRDVTLHLSCTHSEKVKTGKHQAFYFVQMPADSDFSIRVSLADRSRPKTQQKECHAETPEGVTVWQQRVHLNLWPVQITSKWPTRRRQPA